MIDMKGIEHGLNVMRGGFLNDAFGILEPLAKEGDSEAQAALGYIYADDRFSDKDYKKSAEWLHKSAKQGHAEAQLQLGKMYLEEIGVPKSPIHAYMWASIAKTNGLGEAEDVMNLAKEKLAPENLQEAQRLAVQCINSNYRSCE